MLLAGCGGVEVEAEDASSLETREDRIICDDPTTYYRKIYYNDANLTPPSVGAWGCECYGFQSSGRSTAFFREVSGSCE
ncbi:MAG TPA: hypothetical protein VGB96_01010 [Archangium sp.]